jgi:hypothetical protein
MAAFTVLEQSEEDKLHATRLLGIEERPYKRVSKRLLAPTTPIHSFLTRPSPPENHDEIDPTPEADTEAQTEQFLASISRYRQDLLLDFAAFESSILRIQFLRAANVRERERYATEKLKIESTASSVRSNLSDLRVQLEEAQRLLAVRKGYDVLAEGIMRDERLKSDRGEMRGQIEKLRGEIEELERESNEVDGAWRDRREQMGRVVAEAGRLRRVIRDEKEPEPEIEGEKDGDDEEEGREGTSNVNTPGPREEGLTPRPGGLLGSGIGTPRSHVPEGATPARVDEDVEMEAGAAESVPGENIVSAGDVDAKADSMDTT